MFFITKPAVTALVGMSLCQNAASVRDCLTVSVLWVREGGIAERSGLLIGDTVTTIAGTVVEDSTHGNALIKSFPPHVPMEVRVTRATHSRTACAV